jgi:hypothetical protein
MAKLNEVLIDGEKVEMETKEIKKQVLELLEDNSNSENFSNLVLAIVKVSARSAGRKVESKTSVFRARLIEAGSLTEDDIWNEFKWGKHEVLSVCWGFRKKGAPEDFVYVAFNRDENSVGTYSVVGTGAEAPEGYETRNKKKVAAED